MPRAPRNLVNVKDAVKGFASRTVLDGVTLGVGAGDRIGVVGRNGDGKSTLLRLLGGLEEPDAGQVTRAGDLTLTVLAQDDELDPDRTVGDVLVGDRDGWERDGRVRDVLAGLLTGIGLEAPIAPLSGGERRRVALARTLLDAPELLLLDEPTNHLDVEGVAWLARFLTERRGALVVITHDRWFLDAVCTQTWEVADGVVHQYEGGYAAYTLARAERDRQAAASDARRQQLLRKELAWLRRGPPARTAKPKFRIEAANALIADEPPVRDSVELLRFATARLGDRVVDVEEVTAGHDGAPPLLREVTWRLGPGDRVAVVGVNGAGKSTLLKLLDGTLTPQAGRVDRGATVKVGHLTQDAVELPGELRVLQALEQVRGRTTTSGGEELTAGRLAERFGFKGPKQRTLVRELSGGERRRLQLMRLLLDEPNVLLLDEPTNDLDVDTLAALEDLLDGWPGTLVVVSHDRYFVERVTDDVYGLMGDGRIRHLPGGIEQYLALRADAPAPSTATAAASAAPAPERARPSQAVVRAARKEAQRLERALEKLEGRETQLHEDMAAAATDHARLRALQDELSALAAERDELEAAWLEASEAADG